MEPTINLLAILVASGWGIDAVEVESLEGGLINRNWRVTARDGARWFLKEYAPDLAPSALPTLRLQEWVRSQGLPVPAVRPTVSGDLVFHGQDADRPGGKKRPAGVGQGPGGAAVAALSTFEPGRSLRPEELTPRHLAAVGSTLAHLHAALGRHPGPMTPPKVPPRPEVVNARLKELEGLVHGRPFSPEVDKLVLRVLEAKREALARWPVDPETYQGAAWQFLHRDYRLENLLFSEDGQVTAIVDFDFAREGYRAWEVMRAAMTATWRGSGGAGQYGMDLERATPLLEAYLERQPIPRPELQNLGHLWLDYLVRTFWPVSVPYEDPGTYQPGLAAILADRDGYTRWLARNLREVEDWLAGLLH